MKLKTPKSKYAIKIWNLKHPNQSMQLKIGNLKQQTWSMQLKIWNWGRLLSARRVSTALGVLLILWYFLILFKTFQYFLIPRELFYFQRGGFPQHLHPFLPLGGGELPRWHNFHFFLNLPNYYKNLNNLIKI